MWIKRVFKIHYSVSLKNHLSKCVTVFFFPSLFWVIGFVWLVGLV